MVPFVTAARSPGIPTGLDADRLLHLYYWMRLTRALEERIVSLKRQGKIAGGVYRSLGQEAETVGAAAAIDPRRGDVLCPMIRNLGAILVCGATPTEILRQNLARRTAPTGGREQSFHFADLRRGFVGHIAHLGDMVPVMAGMALAFRRDGNGRVALTFAGDGTASTGAFHEGLNFAAVQRLPLVVIIENNGYAYSTPGRRQTAVAHLRDKALAYGLEGVTVDGNDVLAVHQAARTAVAAAREGRGTALIEVVTYRRTGHAEHDNQAYVPAGEQDRWAKADPLDRYRERLLAAGWVEAVELRQIDANVASELDAAVAAAEAEPETTVDAALGGVLQTAGVGDQPEWYRRLDA